MKKHSHKKTRNFTPVKTRQPSYALALIRTKTLQFTIGVVVVTLFVAASGFSVIKTRASLKPKSQLRLKTPPIVITPTSAELKYYTVQEGESLWDVASRAYGNPYEYTKLLDLNNIANPDTVDPGTRLRVQ
ncbi:MAG: LysM domain-containing protein [Patescibacteria group bacterium]|jgi:nucleoid-associated protein YgaU